MTNHNRDKFGPMFEAVATDFGFDIAHSPCQCGYEDTMTTLAFAGFLMAFIAIDNKDGSIVFPEPIPGMATEKIRVIREGH